MIVTSKMHIALFDVTVLEDFVSLKEFLDQRKRKFWQFTWHRLVVRPKGKR